MDDLTCVKCGKKFAFYQNKGRPVPRFCSHECRGHTGFRPGGQFRNSEISHEERFEKLKKSFEKHVIRQDGCWGWKGSIAHGGYPVMSCRKEIGPDRGHRASWIIHKGEIPVGKHVCHYCDNPICTNPEHLWIGTNKDNNDDKIRKGREANYPPPKKRGINNGACKLSEVQVKEIKFLLEKGLTSREIGSQYGISKTHILRIKNGKNWTHI